MSFTFTKYYIQRIVPCEMSFEVMLSMYLLDSTSFDSAITGEYTESLHQMKFHKQLGFFLIKYFPYYKRVYIAHALICVHWAAVLYVPFAQVEQIK